MKYKWLIIAGAVLLFLAFIWFRKHKANKQIKKNNETINKIDKQIEKNSEASDLIGNLKEDSKEIKKEINDIRDKAKDISNQIEKNENILEKYKWGR